MTGLATRARLLSLPTELIQQILGYLEPLELANLARTCKTLRDNSHDDQLWLTHVNRHLSNSIAEAPPSCSFRELYVAHHPHWFLPRHRIWFSDSEPSGKLIVCRYEADSGCIQGYTVTARRGNHSLEFWEKDRDVIIHSFEPKLSLDLSRPVLKLAYDSPKTEDQSTTYPSDRGYAPPSRYSKETLMENFSEARLHASFMLCRELPEIAISDNTQVWPPLRFPATARTRNETRDNFNSVGHRPTKLSEVSEHNFRLRKWVEYSGQSAPSRLRAFSSPHALAAVLGFSGSYFTGGANTARSGGREVRMPEDITTYATLPEWCYTPTSDKPWQGIWCGDYSGHGCEFLVIRQPDKQDERPLPSGMRWLQHWFSGGGESEVGNGTTHIYAEPDVQNAEEEEEEEGNAAGGEAEDGAVDNAEVQGEEPTGASRIFAAVLDHAISREAATVAESSSQAAAHHITDYKDAPTGRLEAIKLTGDPNIPRGEYTFIAPDIGHGGFMRIADERTFRGARIVKSAGHVAGRGFMNDQYTPSQLIMISHDKLAQFWEGFGHISYYERVDLDALMRFGDQKDAAHASSSQSARSFATFPDGWEFENWRPSADPGEEDDW